MKSGPFARLWRAGLVSSIGDWVAILATLSLADELAGGSGIVLALTSRIVPGLFFAAVGGVIADRLNRKHVMVAVEVGRAALVFSLAFVRSIEYLVLVNLALEGLTLVFQPAKEAAVPTLVQRNELVQANSLSLSAAYGTFPLGAGIFLALSPLASHFTLWGLLPGSHEGMAFFVDAITYLVSGSIVFTLPLLGHDLGAERRRRSRLDLMAPLRDLKTGVKFVATHPRVRPVVMAMTAALAGSGIVIVLGKPYSTDVLDAGSSGFPALLTAFGLGAGLGIIMVTIFGPRLEHKDVSFGLALLITGVGLGAEGFIKTILGGIGLRARLRPPPRASGGRDPGPDLRRSLLVDADRTADIDDDRPAARRSLRRQAARAALRGIADGVGGGRPGHDSQWVGDAVGDPGPHLGDAPQREAPRIARSRLRCLPLVSTPGVRSRGGHFGSRHRP